MHQFIDFKLEEKSFFVLKFLFEFYLKTNKLFSAKKKMLKKKLFEAIRNNKIN